MSQYDLIAQGRFTSDGTARTIQLPSDVDFFEVINETDWGDTTAVTNVKSWWQRGLADGAGWGLTQDVTSNALSSNDITSNGFTLITSNTPQLGPLISNATSSSTNADPIEVTINSHGLNDGDIVILEETTAALQIAGFPWYIDNTTTNTFDLPYTGQAPGSAATQVRARKVLYPDLYLPQRRHITNVSTGSTTDVEFSVTHGFSVGQQLRFTIPDEWGMTELDGLTGIVTAVDTSANNVTVDIDSSSFTSFDWPTSAQAGSGVNFATAQPIGETADVFDGSFQAQGFIGINLGTSVVGPNDAVMYWRAWKATRVANN